MPITDPKRLPSDQPGPVFTRYIGIDYSGAATPDTGLTGLRIYRAEADGPVTEVLPPPGSGKYWCRRAAAAWLLASLRDPRPALVGIDHGFSFPLPYFEHHRLPQEWDRFLEDFRQHWPTDEFQVSVECIRKGRVGDGPARGGSARWRRLTEQRCRAKSVFHFDVPGSVAKSTHAGLPWLLYLRRQLGQRLHCWPFDGWEPPRGCSIIAEAYPALWKAGYPMEDRTPDQHDAYVIAAWLRQVDQSGTLASHLRPPLSVTEADLARIEGWILGVAWVRGDWKLGPSTLVEQIEKQLFEPIGGIAQAGHADTLGRQGIEQGMDAGRAGHAGSDRAGIEPLQFKTIELR